MEKVKSKGCGAEIIQSARAINSAADRLRDKYIRFIAELPEQVQYGRKSLKEIFAIDKHTTLWWLSLISEKDTYKSDAFNRLAQLDSIIDIIKYRKITKIIFACTSTKLKSALLKYSNRNSLSFAVSPTRQIGGTKKRILQHQKIFYLKHLLRLLYVAIKLFLMNRRIKGKISNLKRVSFRNSSLLLITYYPNIDMQLAQKGIFKNKYYAHLQEALEREGLNAVWVAMYAENSSISFEQSLEYAKRFIENGYVIFFPEEFNSLSIQIKGLLTMLINGVKFLGIERKIARLYTFGVYNFYPLYKDDWYSSFVGATGYCGIIRYSMFKSLLNKLETRRCLYYCELQTWEKALISARDALGSRMFLLSYQHGLRCRRQLDHIILIGLY